MALRNAFENLGLDSTLQAIRDRLPAALGGTGGVKVDVGSLPASAATSTKQSDGSQKTQVVDGSGNVVGSTSNALDVNVKSGGITGFATASNQTSGSQQTQITDGTNIASVLKSDGTTAGQNAQIVSGTHLAVSFSTTTAQAVGSTDAANYRWVAVQVAAAGTSANVTFQGSNDNSTWTSVVLTNTSSTANSGGTTTTAATTGIWAGGVNYRYFRLNVTGITAGTTSGIIEFFTVPGALNTLGVQASQFGTWTVQPGNTANTTAWLVAGGKTNNNAAPGATNVGALPAIANAAQQSWTEGNAVMASMDLKGNQRMRIADAAGNDRGANVTAASALVVDGSAVTQPVGGDTASGASDAGNPVKVGGLAKTTLPTAVSDGQRVASLWTKTGKLVSVGALREMLGNQQTTIVSSTSETTIITADATFALDLYGLVLTNTSASATKVTIKDSTAGTTRFTFQVPATETRGFMLPVDSAHKQAASNNNWTAICGTSVANMEITALFVKNL